MTDEASSSKERKRAYIALVQDDGTVSERQKEVVIGDSVSETAVSRSALLAGMLNTRGHASLPSGLLSEEIRLWEVACSIDYDLPLEKLVTVLKVADAVGDDKCATWVEQLATRVIATDWRVEHQADTMLCALLRLPPPLLPQVFLQCLTQQDIDDLLAAVPPPLHAAALSAAATQPDAFGNLTLQYRSAAVALHTLSTSPLAAGSLHTLQIQYTETDADRAHPDAAEYPSATGALLARAAAAHPSLTCLDLPGPPAPPAWLRAFSALLPPGALPRLADLDLAAEAHPGGCAEVINCLTRLPALTAVKVMLHLEEEPAPEDVCLSSLSGLAAAHASLPHLRMLVYEEGDYHTYDHVERVGCAGPFLRLMSTSAPTLTHLDFVSAVCTPLEDLLASAARFTALRHLSIDAALRRSDAERVFEAGLPVTLPSLHTCRLHSSCPVSVVTMATAVASATAASITKLQLSLADDGDMYYDRECTAELLTRGWGDFFLSMKSLASVEHLELDSICGVPQGAPGRTAFSHSLGAGLTCLSKLTSMQLKAGWQGVDPEQWTSELDGHVVGIVLESLPSLRALSFSDSGSDIELRIEPMQPVVDACARLGRLETLTVRVGPVTAAQAEALLSNQRLTRLELGEVAVQEWSHSEGVVAGMKDRFPNVFIQVC